MKYHSKLEDAADENVGLGDESEDRKKTSGYEDIRKKIFPT